MPLVTCTDCHQLVSTEAVSCPACGRPTRDRSYLTPMGQVVIGALVLIACLAWPPVFIIVLLVVIARVIRRMARRGGGGAVLAGALLLLVAVGLSYVAPSYAVLILAAALGGCVWLVAS